MLLQLSLGRLHFNGRERDIERLTHLLDSLLPKKVCLEEFDSSHYMVELSLEPTLNLVLTLACDFCRGVVTPFEYDLVVQCLCPVVTIVDVKLLICAQEGASVLMDHSGNIIVAVDKLSLAGFSLISCSLTLCL